MWHPPDCNSLSRRLSLGGLGVSSAANGPRDPSDWIGIRC